MELQNDLLFYQGLSTVLCCVCALFVLLYLNQSRYVGSLLKNIKSFDLNFKALDESFALYIESQGEFVKSSTNQTIEQLKIQSDALETIQLLADRLETYNQRTLTVQNEEKFKH